MTEYIDSLKKQHSLVSDDQRYLFDWSLPIHCPQLASELTIPKYFANDFLQRITPGSLYHDSWPSLFIAPKGLTSKLHIDAFGSNFWMALFQGRKRWMFFSKDDMQLLYPDYISDYTLDPSFDVDIHQCDREQYPLLQLAEPRECILESGELLFVPAGSPHYVENLDQTIAISANYVDLSNLDLVREELAINGLVCDRAAALWKELSSKEFPITMDGSVTDLAWNEFKQWPKSYDFEALSITPYNMNQSKYTASDIFCHGPLLDVIQQSGIYEDSKTFVDMQMLKSPESVLSDFNEFLKQGQLSRETIQKFVQEHFSGPGDELGAWIPEDWSENPKLLQRLQHPSLKQFVRSLNDLWKSLGRKMLPMDHPERHSLIPVPHPFIIPGDRFREFYYWDTYWIVGGLLAVDMIQTARGMLYNLLHLVDKYGFVPNGGRIYYTNRSQPPLLIPMVDLYFERTGDINFLQQNISVLEKEYYFWIQNRTVNAKGPNGAEHEVAMYNVQACEPRPEAYVADINAVKDLSGEARVRMLSDVASACESGWDFSSRWSGSSNKTVMTCHIVPVDLNVYLCWNEQLLEKFHGIFGNKVKQKMFQGKVTARKHAIDDLFWNDDLGAWFDFNLNGSQAKTDFYPSNVFPLFAGCTNLDIGEPTIAKKVLKYVKRCGVFDYPGGIPTSVLNTGEQWDLPNAWSPLVHLFLESIAKLPLVEAQQLVNLSISKWITSNMSALKNHGYMYEKYDATAFGSPGGGGEYEVQTGFGWSIGVDLMLLETYSSKIEPLLKLNV